MDNNTGLVLEGGGMRGVFTTGVLDSFMKHGLYFPYVVAVSAGACNGMSYVSRQPRRARISNIDYLARYDYIGLRYLFTQGSIPPNIAVWQGMNFAQYTEKGIHNAQRFVSAYHTNGEPSYTNYAANYCGVLDYIWLAPGDFRPVQVLDVVPLDELDSSLKPFPNPYYPSDHIPLVADIQLLH